MCTSIAMNTQDFYFGRTMDLDWEFGARVIFTPRNYPFTFRREGTLSRHYALLGMATVSEGYPLYAEAVNETGLCIAGLNFPDSAYYPSDPDYNKANISPFELIFWLLGKCATAAEARHLLENTRLINIPFSQKIPAAPLHWHIADQKESLVLESTLDGMKVRDNPVGVLTNNPTFDFQMTNLCQYLNLTVSCPENCFSTSAKLKPYGQGLGSFGLPGDFSPSSRFVKAAYLRLNSVCREDAQGSVAQFFHLLDAVAMPRGSVVTDKDECDITLYSCCMDAGRGIYYYKTYENNQLTGVDMHREDLEGSAYKEYPWVKVQQVAWAN